MPGASDNLHFYPDKEITDEEKAFAMTKLFGENKGTGSVNLAPTSDVPMSRAQFAIWLYEIVQSKKLFGKI
jgi:hypothetical protein